MIDRSVMPPLVLVVAADLRSTIHAIAPTQAASPGLGEHICRPVVEERLL
jgi:hypothetical protein